jgi:hypothetical protein
MYDPEVFFVMEKYETVYYVKENNDNHGKYF